MTDQRIIPPQVVGNVGLYYAAFRLSQLGWNVMPTARNARGIDLVAYSPDASRYVGVQIKALSKVDNVRVGSDDVMGDAWVIVTNAGAHSPQCFILLPNEVQEGCKNYKGTLWLQKAAYNKAAYKEAWARIGAVSPDQSALSEAEQFSTQ